MVRSRCRGIDGDIFNNHRLVLSLVDEVQGGAARPVDVPVVDDRKRNRQMITVVKGKITRGHRR